MTAEQDERAFHALTQKVSAARGLRCEAYKEKCLRRRLAVRMRARGVHTFEAYGRLLDEDTSEYDRLLDALTINVTKFWRNAGTWQALSDPYLRELWRARRGDVRAWSAGCASGEEPYTVAVALAEVARALGEEAVFATAEARIDATDVDRESLERTAAAQFPDSAFAELWICASVFVHASLALPTSTAFSYWMIMSFSCWRSVLISVRSCAICVIAAKSSEMKDALTERA